jgi:capsid protein
LARFLAGCVGSTCGLARVSSPARPPTDAAGVALAGLEPGTLQILELGEDIKFSDPADLGGSYSEFLRNPFRAVAAAITYEQLTGDRTGEDYSSIRAGRCAGAAVRQRSAA